MRARFLIIGSISHFISFTGTIHAKAFLWLSKIRIVIILSLLWNFFLVHVVLLFYQAPSKSRGLWPSIPINLSRRPTQTSLIPFLPYLLACPARGFCSLSPFPNLFSSGPDSSSGQPFLLQTTPVPRIFYCRHDPTVLWLVSLPFFTPSHPLPPR